MATGDGPNRRRRRNLIRTASVHHRRVVIVPMPTWYLDCRGSHNRNYATCAARNMPYSLAVYSAATWPRAKSLRWDRLGNIVSGTICETSSWLLGGKSSSAKNRLLLAGGIGCDATGEKEWNPNPELLVATGWGLGRISFARSAAEAPRVAWMVTDDEELPAASERAETRSAVSAWVAIYCFADSLVKI